MMWRNSLSALRLTCFLLTLLILLGLTLTTSPIPPLLTPTFVGAIVLIALCQFFPILIAHSEITFAHIVGLGVLFIFGPTPAAWALALGLVAGEIARLLRRASLRRQEWALFAAEFTLQVLAILVASSVFLRVGGQFPLTTINARVALQLGAFSVFYLGFYSGLLPLRFESIPEAARLFTNLSLSELVALEILPIPLTVYAAVSALIIGPSLLFVLGGGLVVMAVSMNRLTRTQVELRQQMEQNAQLFAEAQSRLRELTVLHQAGSTLASTLNRQQIYSTLVQELSNIIQADEGVVLEFDETASLLRPAQFWTPPGGSPHAPTEVCQLNQYPGIRRLLTERAPAMFRADAPDLDPAAQDRLSPRGFGALLVLPLTTSEQVVGLVELYTVHPRDFTEAEIRLGQTLSNQATIALANARLLYRATEGRDRLVAVLNATRDGALMIDANGAISLVNPRLEEMWGLPAGRLLGHNLLHLLNQPELDLANKLGFQPEEIIELLQTLRAGLALSIPKTQYLITEPKRRHVERSGAPVLDQYAKAIGWVITLRDTTEEKEIQEVREELTNMIVHDLRSPLTVVLASLTLVRTQIGQSPMLTQAVEVAARSVNKMVGMVNTLLDIARIESGGFTLQRVTVNPRDLVTEIINDFTPLANEQGIVLLNEVPATLPELLIDRDKVGRVLMNLLDNSLKFTPPGGQIWVRITARGDDPQWLQWAVADTGPGIPADYRDKIFDRFVQVQGRTGRRGGTGLGLAFCKLVVEAHGGKIWVDSPPAGGSAFYFTLPIGGGSPHFYTPPPPL